LWKKQAKLELSGYMEKEAAGSVGFMNFASYELTIEML